MKDIKSIILTIPSNAIFSKEIYDFTPEQTIMALNIGIEAVLQHKNLPVKIDTDLENEYKKKNSNIRSSITKIRIIT
jgi:hypothetical protein